MTRYFLHPFPLRAWHWANTVLILVLIVSGIQLRAPDIEVFSGYRTAVLVHKATGFIMALSFLFWLFYTLIGRKSRRQYLLLPKDLKGAIPQTLYYLFGVFRGAKNPFSATPEKKFNVLQKTAYITIQFVFTPVIVITGIFFSDILLFGGPISMIGGIRMLDAIHVIAAYFFVAYLFIHLYMATLGGTVLQHIKAMFTGYEEEH